VPLGGSRVPLPRWCLNVMVVFLASGLWHGASWTFVVWGALHGVYLVMSRLTAAARERTGLALGLAHHPLVLRGWRVVATFHLVALGWVFFRASSLADGAWIVTHVARSPLFAWPAEPEGALGLSPFRDSNIQIAVVLIVFLLVAEWLASRPLQDLLRMRQPLPVWVRWPAYYALVVAILWLGVMGSRSFIYFQF
jgi:hypothetical protein